MTDDEPDTLSRGEPEREQAERRYVSALVALDTAAESSPTVGSTAAAAATDVVRLNEIWHQQGTRPPGQRAGLFARLLSELGRMLPWRRRRLLGAMIAAINRNADTTRAVIDASQHFHSHVIWYAQTVAALAAAPRRGETGPQSVEALHQAINALGSDWLMHWESLAAREARYDARMAALTDAYAELKEVASIAQQSTLSLKRAVEALSAAEPHRLTDAASAPPPATASPDTNAFKYVGFEDRFRGPREEIRQRLLPYLPVFAGTANVLEIGCGRGELLDLFREHHIDARGVDTNDEMVSTCRARGLHADRGDALAWLDAQPDGSLGGLVAIQVVEHMEPGYLMRVLETAHHKLKAGAPMVLETINPACWAAFFDGYIRDLTHARPLHPDTLKYLVHASGFATVDVRYASPVAEADKLPSVKLPATTHEANPAMSDLADALNAHATRLNSRLFTFRDYAIIARK